MISHSKIIAPIAVSVLLVLSGQVARAGAANASSCPEPTAHVRDALENLADRLAVYEERGLPVPMSAVQSVKSGDIRTLTSQGDEKVCQALYHQEHSEYLEKTWNEELSIQGDIYPYYDAGYFKVGDYYLVVFVKTPTPQNKDITETRVVTGYNTALIYDEHFEKISGYSF